MGPQPAGRGLKKESLPDPSLYLSPGQNQSPEVGGDGVDEVARLVAKVEQESERDAKAALEEIAKDKAIQEQLARLKVRPAGTEQQIWPGVDVQDDEDVDDLEEEGRLDEEHGGMLPPPSSKTAGEPDELPWCVICN